MEVLAVEGLPEVKPGDDLADLVSEQFRLRSGDVVVVAQKIVSKAEGQVRDLRRVQVSESARVLAGQIDGDARIVQLILEESIRIVRQERVLIVETRHGFVCANAGIDHSNVPGEDSVTLLPEDSDASADRLRSRLRERTGLEVAVIVADTFGRAWRMGIANVALGVSGLPSLVDYRGQKDDFGQEMYATVIAVADELAAAAELVMGKTARIPVAVIRGYTVEGPPGRGLDLIRPAELDLFR